MGECVFQRSHIDLQVGSLFSANMAYDSMLQVDFEHCCDFLRKWLNVNKRGRYAILGYNLFRSPDYMPDRRKGKYIFLMAISLSVSGVYQAFHLPAQGYSNIIYDSVPTIPSFQQKNLCYIMFSWL